MAIRYVRWTERAITDAEKLFDYLLEEWGEEIALRVQGQIEGTVVRIRNSPEHFQIFIKKKHIRRCVVSPQTSIFFQIKGDEIVIITLFDNRQNPKKLNL